jgi:hypothetical protein
MTRWYGAALTAQVNPVHSTNKAPVGTVVTVVELQPAPALALGKEFVSVKMSILKSPAFSVPVTLSTITKILLTVWPVANTWVMPTQFAAAFIVAA